MNQENDKMTFGERVFSFVVGFIIFCAFILGVGVMTKVGIDMGNNVIHTVPTAVVTLMGITYFGACTFLLILGATTSLDICRGRFIGREF